MSLLEKYNWFRGASMFAFVATGSFVMSNPGEAMAMFGFSEELASAEAGSSLATLVTAMALRDLGPAVGHLWAARRRSEAAGRAVAAVTAVECAAIAWSEPRAALAFAPMILLDLIAATVLPAGADATDGNGPTKLD